MTLKKINENEQNNIHDRSCIIVVNFKGKEDNIIKTVAGFVGIKDKICVTSKNGNTKIKNILDGDISNENNDIWSEKAIIFNNISSNKITGFLEGLKKMKIKKPLYAVVTETSVNWSLNTLIYNLKEERKAISKGNFANHQK